MESTSTDEVNVPWVPVTLSLVSVVIFVLTSVVLMIIGVAAEAWADQLFTCAPYQEHITILSKDGCRWYPGLHDFHDLEFQIWTAMAAIIFALNIVVWTVRGLLWVITKH